MKPLFAAMALVVLASRVALADDAAMFRELQEARVAELALYVSDVSKGGSRLLIGQAKGANPAGGFVTRDIVWGDLPIITCYPLYAPVMTKLGGLGDSLVLGAVRTLVLATPLGAPGVAGDGKNVMAPPGVYLLAYQGKLADVDKETGRMSLISVSVDQDGKIQVNHIMGVRAERESRPDTMAGENYYAAWAEFPTKGQDMPASRATVKIAVKEPVGQYRYAVYSFQLDLQVTME